jgi:hypothetical protein
MTPAQARLAWHELLAEEFGRTACTDMHLRWENAAYDSARLAGHFGRLALGANDDLAGLALVSTNSTRLRQVP